MHNLFPKNFLLEGIQPDYTSVVGDKIFLKGRRNVYDNHPGKRWNWEQKFKLVDLILEKIKYIVYPMLGSRIVILKNIPLSA